MSQLVGVTNAARISVRKADDFACLPWLTAYLDCSYSLYCSCFSTDQTSSWRQFRLVICATLATRAINLNVPAPLLLSIFKMDTATTRKVGRVTYCTGIVTIGSSPEFEAAAEQAIIDYAKKEAKDEARYKFLAEPTLAAFRKTRGQLPRQALKVQYSAQILDNGNWSIQDVSVNLLSTR